MPFLYTQHSDPKMVLQVPFYDLCVKYHVKRKTEIPIRTRRDCGLSSLTKSNKLSIFPLYNN